MLANEDGEQAPRVALQLQQHDVAEAVGGADPAATGGRRVGGQSGGRAGGVGGGAVASWRKRARDHAPQCRHTHRGSSKRETRRGSSRRSSEHSLCDVGLSVIVTRGPGWVRQPPADHPAAPARSSREQAGRSLVEYSVCHDAKCVDRSRVRPKMWAPQTRNLIVPCGIHRAQFPPSANGASL